MAFRTTSGKVGLFDFNCPHRGTSFFYGRNEEEGIRCVYHRLEVRCDWALRGHAKRAPLQQLQGQGSHQGLPLHRAQRDYLDIHGPALDASSLA